jgi:hypothetical protein
MMQGDADVRRVKLVDLNPATYNPRKIDDTAREGLSNSIDQFGLLSLIVWNERTGNIVGGHQRFRKLVESGESETDVVVVDLTEDEEVALNIVLNSPYARGEFSSDVKVMLEKVEVQIGSIFNDLHLNDLHEQISRALGKDKNKDKPKEPYEPPDPDPSPDGENDDDEEEAIIICPKCKGMWRMADNEVILNAQKEDSEQVEGGDNTSG